RRWQLQEILDRSIADTLPQQIVLGADVLVRRLGGPLDAEGSQLFQPHLDGQIAPVERRVDRHPQAGDLDKVSPVACLFLQTQEVLIGARERRGEDLALGTAEREWKREWIMLLPVAVGQQ